MDKILHVASTFKSHESEDGSVMIRGMASTNHSDRAGDVIAPEAWQKGGLENFKNNPVILFNHDYNKPIGRATGVKVTDNGLELEAKISKAAKDVCDLVKDGVLGAFSVGFKCKDADYIEETDGLMIKDAELFEVSVVTVPCNQAATFSLAKSFDSIEEYENFKKTFTNRVDLTGQSLTSKDSIDSNVVSDAPKQVEKSTVKETKMSEDTKTPEIDLEAFAKKVADETAAKIAMKQAETKAAEEAEAKAAAEAEAQKAAQEEQVKSTIRTGIETGAEKLMADVQADMEKASIDQIAEVTKKYEAELKEKSEELEQMRQSKRNFTDRSSFNPKSGDNKDILHAKILGAATGKGWNTDYAREVFAEKAVSTTATDPDSGSETIGLDLAVSTQFEKEVQAATNVANVFREVQVAQGATVIPIQPDSGLAQFSAAGLDTTSNILEDRTNQAADGADDAFDVGQKIAQAFRLVQGTFISSDTDEQTVVSLLPMLSDALARGHARAIDSSIIRGCSKYKGLFGGTGTEGANSPLGQGIINNTDTAFLLSAAEMDVSDKDLVTSTMLLKARATMGKYAMDPSQVTIFVGIEAYHQLLTDSAFADVNQVGAENAYKLQGVVGNLYGSPVVATEFLTRTTSETVAFGMAYTPNYIIPRLRGVTIQSDYIVKEQRTAIVAAQSLGFTELVTGYAGNYPSIYAVYQD